MEKKEAAGSYLIKSALAYTSCYCEENVYKLCEQFEQLKRPD